VAIVFRSGKASTALAPLRIVPSTATQPQRMIIAKQVVLPQVFEKFSYGRTGGWDSICTDAVAERVYLDAIVWSFTDQQTRGLFEPGGGGSNSTLGGTG